MDLMAIGEWTPISIDAEFIFGSTGLARQDVSGIW